MKLSYVRLPSHLPVHPSDGISTLAESRSTVIARLPRYHRAGPSTSLDKSAVRGSTHRLFGCHNPFWAI